MPDSGGFSQIQQVAGAEERPEAHAEACERVRAALLAVHDTDRGANDELLGTECLHRLR